MVRTHALLVFVLGVAIRAAAKPFVHSDIYKTLRGEASMEVMFHFREDANLDDLTFLDENRDGFISRSEKRTQVYRILKDFSTSYQKKAISRLDLFPEVKYKSFWIVNALMVENLNLEMMQNVLEL